MDHERENERDREGHDHHVVTIIVDDKQYSIHRGEETVVAIKTLAGVPLAYDLDQVVHGKFEPLPDDGRIAIKGGKTFVSHPKDGKSS